MDKIKTFFDGVWKYKDLILIAVIVILIIVISRSCSSLNKYKRELQRQQNNELAMRDSLSVYKDELGRVNAEKHAYQLTQKEMMDSIDNVQQKNREYISYLKTQLGIKDTFEVICYIDRPYRDTSKLDNGIITIDTTDVFEKSSRHLYVAIPYDIDTVLHLEKSMFSIEQNVFLEGWLERNTKNGETFVHLRSDYPGMTFNSGEGFVATNSPAYERSMRKTWGVGLFVGPSFSVAFHDKWFPCFGISLGIGLTYTPRRLQF